MIEELPDVDRELIFIPDGYKHLGWIFIDDDALRDSGYNPGTFGIVKIGGLHYELQAFIPKANCWWIQLVDPTEAGDASWIKAGRSSRDRWHEILADGGQDPEVSDSPMSKESPSPSSANMSQSSPLEVIGFLRRSLMRRDDPGSS